MSDSNGTPAYQLCWQPTQRIRLLISSLH